MSRRLAILAIIVGLAATILPASDGHARTDPFRDVKADKVLVLKGQRLLFVLRQGMILAVHRVALGRNPVGDKIMEGDSRTPEGWYVLDRRNPNSQFYRAIHISYPNNADKALADSLGVRAGGNILIHGQPNGFERVGLDSLRRDWTAGCIAVSNDAMDEIWDLVEDGTPIEIRP